MLRQVATGITPQMLDSPSSLEWLLQHGLPAVQFFDSMQVARQDGQLRVNLQYGRLDNRQGCERRLHLLLAERLARRHKYPGNAPPEGAGGAWCDGVFLYLDLDYFTLVNLVAGHDAGDDVLCHVAQLLQAQVGQGGWVARLGGDEYGVVLPGCTAAHGAVVAEQLRAVVQAWEPVYQGRSFTLGASVGMVVLDARTQDVAAVLQAGDMACYDAKRAGRNQVVQHAPLPGAVG